MTCRLWREHSVLRDLRFASHRCEVVGETAENGAGVVSWRTSVSAFTPSATDGLGLDSSRSEGRGVLSGPRGLLAVLCVCAPPPAS